MGWVGADVGGRPPPCWVSVGLGAGDGGGVGAGGGGDVDGELGDGALAFDPHRPADLAALLERIELEPGVLEDVARRGQARLATLDDAERVTRAVVSVLSGEVAA